MPVPSLITDLSQTASSNYPQGTDSPSTLDDTQRAHGSFIAMLRDGKGFTNPVQVASGATTDIGGQNSMLVEITGTTTITSFGTTYNGPRFLRFTGALTLTHNAIALNLPTAANITTTAGDAALAIPTSTTNGWNVVYYQRANGTALTASGSNVGSSADIASAATIDLTAVTGQIVRITGTTASSAVTMNNGQRVVCVAVAAWPLTYNATTMPVPGSANYTCSAGDIVIFTKDGSGTISVQIYKKDGTDVVSPAGIQTIAASVSSNALTISAGSLSLDFRSTTLGSGAVTKVTGTPANLVISNGSTLGTSNGLQSDIAVLAINNAGTIELAAVNIAGSIDLSETGLISTTAEGGAGAADSATTVYSTTARTNVAYRVIGMIRSTQATAGSWATSPTLVQGVGGQALAAFSTVGYGQTWQTPARSIGTTYYNTTGRPILVAVSYTNNTAACVAGLAINGANVYASGTASLTAANAGGFCLLVPPGGSYVTITNVGTLTLVSWAELR